MKYTVLRQMQGYTYKLGTGLSLVAASAMSAALAKRGITCTMRAWVEGETCLS